jgi:signal transduction histidine kinase
MDRIFPWKQTTIVVAAALMALASLAVSVGMSLRLQESIGTVQSARDLRRQMSMVGTALREAEAAQRMYVITGDEAHLAPLVGAKTSLPDRWKAVLDSAEVVPDFSADFAELELETLATLDMLEDTAEVRRTTGREAAVAIVESGESHQQLVAVHMKLDALMEQLERRTEEQTRSLARAESRGRAASVSTGLVALALGALGVWQWRGSLRHFRRELELSAARARAEQMARDKSDFLASMSHEVRTPLNAILGMSEQLAAAAPDGDVRGKAEAISEAGRGMLRLVNDLLDLSRMDAGRLELRCTAVHMPSQLDWWCRMLQPVAAEKGVQLETSAAADMPAALWMDEGRFRQIVMNLTGNALKFTPPGGQVRVRLERSENASGPELVLEVKDNGCGIPREMQARIFQPYVQGLTAHDGHGHSPSGAGLGLAIVQQLVRLMKGTISLQSQAGSGSTFRVVLPLRTPPEQFPPAEPVPAPAVNSASPVSAVATGALAGEFAARLQRIMDENYPPAAATQSTGDVRVLAEALDRLGSEAHCQPLAEYAAELRRASSTFAIAALSAALESLPGRLKPLMRAA